MAELRTVHTADLGAHDRATLRALLDAAFGGEFDDHDWEHALGGLHVTAWEGDVLVAHAAVVQRRVLHAGRALRTGYVEGVAVRADRRRRGHGRAVMAAVGRIVTAAYDLGALAATDAAVRLYEACGWEPWAGPTAALTPSGIVPTPDAAVHVLRAGARLRPAEVLACDWRDGDVW